MINTEDNNEKYYSKQDSIFMIINIIFLIIVLVVSLSICSYYYTIISDTDLLIYLLISIVLTGVSILLFLILLIYMLLVKFLPKAKMTITFYTLYVFFMLVILANILYPAIIMYYVTSKRVENKFVDDYTNFSISIWLYILFSFIGMIFMTFITGLELNFKFTH